MSIRDARLALLSSLLRVSSRVVSNKKSRSGWKNKKEKLDTCSPHYASSANESRHLNLPCCYYLKIQKPKWRIGNKRVLRSLLISALPSKFSRVFTTNKRLETCRSPTRKGKKCSSKAAFAQKRNKCRILISKSATARPALQRAAQSRKGKTRSPKRRQEPKKTLLQAPGPGSVHAGA